jgi:hypothetical protein
MARLSPIGHGSRKARGRLLDSPNPFRDMRAASVHSRFKQSYGSA